MKRKVVFAISFLLIFIFCGQINSFNSNAGQQFNRNNFAERIYSYEETFDYFLPDENGDVAAQKHTSEKEAYNDFVDDIVSGKGLIMPVMEGEYIPLFHSFVIKDTEILGMFGYCYDVYFEEGGPQTNIWIHPLNDEVSESLKEQGLYEAIDSKIEIENLEALTKKPKKTKLKINDTVVEAIETHYIMYMGNEFNKSDIMADITRISFVYEDYYVLVFIPDDVPAKSYLKGLGFKQVRPDEKEPFLEEVKNAEPRPAKNYNEYLIPILVLGIVIILCAAGVVIAVVVRKKRSGQKNKETVPAEE